MNNVNFTRDIYLATDAQGLATFADLISVKPDFVYIDNPPMDDLRFEARENFIIATTILGDFRYIAEIFIWDRTESDMLPKLQNASAKDLAIVIEDTDEDASPLDEVLFFNGKRHAAEIGHDDVFQEVFLTKPKQFRASLLALSARTNPGV